MAALDFEKLTKFVLLLTSVAQQGVDLVAGIADKETAVELEEVGKSVEAGRKKLAAVIEKHKQAGA